MNVNSLWHQWPAVMVGLTWTFSRAQEVCGRMLINNVILVFPCVWPESQEADQHLCALSHLFHHTCTFVTVHVLCIMGQIIQCSPPLLQPMRPSPPSPYQAYHAQPFLLVKSNIQQKETSAQWENALIIHDHLSIQDLVWVADVAFHIRRCETAKLLNGSFFSVLYYQSFCIIYNNASLFHFIHFSSSQ